MENLMETVKLPGLIGSLKQIEWAERIRASRIAYAELLIDDSGFLGVTRQQAKAHLIALSGIAAAHWWIETRALTLKRFMLAAGDEGATRLHVTPRESDHAAQAVLAASTLAPIKVHGPVAEISLRTDKVRVVLIEFDQPTNAVLKRSGYRWDDPAWTRQVLGGAAEDLAIEIAVRLLAHGCPVRIFEEALRKRAGESDYMPEPARRVEVSSSEKYGTKFRLVWALDPDPRACKGLVARLSGAKVFDDAAYVSASHFEDIEDFAGRHGFTITQQAQMLIDDERRKLSGAVKIKPNPKTAPGLPAEPALAVATGEIDAALRDD